MHSDLSVPDAQTPVSSSPRPPVARWRWWVALLILGGSPLVMALLSASRNSADDLRLPKSVTGLLLYCGFQLLIFAVFYGVAWAFSRANREELFLPWRGGWKVPLWGLGYSLLMRFGLVAISMVFFVFIAIGLALLGIEPEALQAFLKANSGGAEKVFVPALTQGNWIYRVLLMTLVSFVVAGLREELWRVAVMASLRHLTPRGWSPRTQNAVALGVSSSAFGLLHLYQGWVGVIATSLLGIAMGAITLRHRSVWPAVFAHGFFNATTFLSILALTEHMPRSQ